MTFLAEADLFPSGTRDELESAAEALLADLFKQGNVWGHPLLTWIGDRLHVSCQIPCVDSLEERFLRGYTEGALRALRTASAQPLRWSVRGTASLSKGTPDAVLDCRSFYLMTHMLDRTSPIVAGDEGDPIPLYLLPISERLRERLTFWMRSYAAHDHVWFDSAELEFGAHNQLANVESKLSRSGQALCSAVEAATGRPTFFYLFAYYVRSSATADLCPGCRQAWSRSEPTSDRGLDSLPLQCVPCRIVSQHGVVTSRTLEDLEG